MFLRKAQAGSAPGYTWEGGGQVIEVEDELAYQLLAMPDGGFSQATPSASEEETIEAFDAAFEQGESVEILEEPEVEEEVEADSGPRRSPGRPRLPPRPR